MRSPLALLFSVAALAAGSSTGQIPATLEEAPREHGEVGPEKAEPRLEALPTPAPTPSATMNEANIVNGWTITELRSKRRLPNGTETGEACGYERDVIVRRGADVTPAVLVVACKSEGGLPVPAPPVLRLPPPYGVAAAAAGDKDIAVDVSVGPFLNTANVVAVVSGMNAAIAACHKATGGAKGTLQMRFVVGVAGAVTEAGGVDGTLASTTTDRCIAELFRQTQFEAPRDGSSGVVTTSFTFPLRGTGLFKRIAAADADLAPCAAGVAPIMTAGELSCLPPPPPPPTVIPPHPCAPGEIPKSPAQRGPGEEACFVVESERGVPFLKGELTSFGDVQLVNARNSVGVGLGINVIDSTYYAVVRPDVNLKFGNFSLGLGAPLRFEVIDLAGIDVFGGDPLGGATANAGRFRTEDWDQIEDFVRPIRYLTWGKKEDQLYIDLNRVRSSTIGHGQLVRRYSPNLDIDEDNLFAQVDGYGDYGGVELMAGPFPVPRLVGGLAFIKPLGILKGLTQLGAPPTPPQEAPAPDDSYLSTLASSWSVGFSYVTDLNSPTGLERRLNPADQRPQLIVDNANQLVWRNKANPVGDVVQGIGVDTEVKVLKTGPADIKVYGDYSHLFFPGDSSTENAFSAFSGGGATVGGLLRLSLGEKPVRDIEDEDEETKAGRKPREKKAAHGLRLRLEGRTFAPTYLPSYWNGMYEADRFQFGFDDNRLTLPTKIRYLADQEGEPWRLGYYAEFSYAWVDFFGVTATFEDAYALGDSAPVRGKNLGLHVESKGLGWVQLFASYHFRNFEAAEFEKVFSFDSDNEILFVGGRLQILPILFVNVGAQRAFRIGFSADDVLAPNDKGERFTSIGLQNSTVIGADVELGWQF
jgi:hypothetical protein